MHKDVLNHILQFLFMSKTLLVFSDSRALPGSLGLSMDVVQPSWISWALVALLNFSVPQFLIGRWASSWLTPPYLMERIRQIKSIKQLVTTRKGIKEISQPTAVVTSLTA